MGVLAHTLWHGSRPSRPPRPPSQWPVQVGTLLKQYQEEIDRLTKRAKHSEAAFLSLYTQLTEAPDPAHALSMAFETASRVTDTEAQLRKVGRGVRGVLGVGWVTQECAGCAGGGGCDRHVGKAAQGGEGWEGRKGDGGVQGVCWEKGG